MLHNVTFRSIVTVDNVLYRKVNPFCRHISKLFVNQSLFTYIIINSLIKIFIINKRATNVQCRGNDFKWQYARFAFAKIKLCYVFVHRQLLALYWKRLRLLLFIWFFAKILYGGKWVQFHRKIYFWYDFNVIFFDQKGFND